MLKLHRCLVGLVVLAITGPVWADLKPEQVAILAVKNSPESQELASYYAQARGIPASQICSIDVEPSKTLDRQQWETQLRPYLRNWLLEKQLEQQILCLVTTWDVPLKIGRAPSEESAGRKAFMEAERRLRVQRIAELLDQVNRLAADENPEAVDLPPEAPAADISKRMSDAFRNARIRLQQAQGRSDAQNLGNEFLRAIGQGGGLRASIQVLSREKIADPAKELELLNKTEQAKGRLVGLTEGRNALDWLPESVEKDEQMLAMVEATDGLLGSISWLDGQIELLNKNETYSSFDSELSLIFWPNYPLMRWAPNVLNHRFDDSALRHSRFTLMVARLEAPTMEIAKRLVDEAVQVEKDGLVGKVYLDARGIRATDESGRGSYADYDEALRNLAAILQEHTELEVILDNKPDLFEADACPNTALYCGWYSLAKYVDAFTFQPGAVGYHIASSEATTLRDAQSEVWCKRMLEDGIAATLGPVFEPYLAAFPRPDEFFVALCSGRLTLVECYYRTKPFNSWAMTLVGDPLYNPFRNSPALQVEELPSDLKAIIE